MSVYEMPGRMSALMSSAYNIANYGYIPSGPGIPEEYTQAVIGHIGQSVGDVMNYSMQTPPAPPLNPLAYGMLPFGPQGFGPQGFGPQGGLQGFGPTLNGMPMNPMMGVNPMLRQQAGIGGGVAAPPQAQGGFAQLQPHQTGGIDGLAAMVTQLFQMLMLFMQQQQQQ